MTTALITELRSEHEFLLDQVKKITNLGANTEEGLALLLGVKDALLAHLGKEDKELYPLLNKNAQEDDSLFELLQRMSTDMAEITQFVLDFFARLAQDPSSREIYEDFLTLGKKLNKRIRLEEVTLYEEFERLSEI